MGYNYNYYYYHSSYRSLLMNLIDPKYPLLLPVFHSLLTKGRLKPPSLSTEVQEATT